MTDQLAAHEADWRRRRSIARRWGGGAALAGFAAFFIYWIMMPTLPASPNFSTGNVYRVFNLQGRYSPLFRYGTHTEFLIALALGGIMLVSFASSLVIFYIYDPNAIYRGVSRELR